MDFRDYGKLCEDTVCNVRFHILTFQLLIHGRQSPFYPGWHNIQLLMPLPLSPNVLALQANTPY